MYSLKKTIPLLRIEKKKKKKKITETCVKRVFQNCLVAVPEFENQGVGPKTWESLLVA